MGVMLDVHYRFREMLKKTDALIVCGYSFGDKGINTQLIHWYSRGPQKSMILIDPLCYSEVRKNARDAPKRELLAEEKTYCINRLELMPNMEGLKAATENKKTYFVNEKMEDIESSQLTEWLQIIKSIRA